MAMASGKRGKPIDRLEMGDRRKRGLLLNVRLMQGRAINLACKIKPDILLHGVLQLLES